MSGQMLSGGEWGEQLDADGGGEVASGQMQSRVVMSSGTGWQHSSPTLMYLRLTTPGLDP